MVEKEDIISLLPDELLHRILSFLPTKNAVSTCLLAKRWQYLWMSTTSLDFDCKVGVDYNWDNRNKFSRFVDGVLRFHSSSSITRFRLVNWTVDPTFFEQWISAALERHVQKIHLSFQSPPTLLLPRCLCTSAFLTVLKLGSLSCLHLPSVICFSSLKKLILERIEFLDDSSFNRLFSGLPVIIQLGLYACRWDKIMNDSISLSTLKYLTICTFFDLACSKLKVNAENLRYLIYATELEVDLVLENVPLLVDAFIKIRRYGWEAVERHAANLFTRIRFVKSLRVGKGSLKNLETCNKEKIKLFPEFVNLTTLEVYSKVNLDGGGVLMDILNSSSILESYVIKKVHCDTVGFTPWWDEIFLPQCIEFSLKECYLLCFTESLGDEAFVKFIVKNARSLKRLKLYFTSGLCMQSKRLKKLMRRLKKVRRVSKECVIEFLKS